MDRLKWENLLSTNRLRGSNAVIKGQVEGKHIVARNQFEADYDRIVGSSSVRRLQDKAQVFPLQENDVTRTRLTHSMEVSAMARSLGKAVGKQLVACGEMTEEQVEEFSALLQTAGLIHDLGNPPFGHYGEDIIRAWFKEWFASDKRLGKSNTVISEQEKNDFIYFDGNVQNLRIVMKLQTLNDLYGANFTYGTLATIIKYPWRSDKRWENKSKFGYFKSEEDAVKQIREEIGLENNMRHPATYLLEAADDIIYLCDDIEDGVKKRYIDWSLEYDELKKKLQEDKYKQIFAELDKKVTDPRMSKSEIQNSKVRNFRNRIQTYLFEQAVTAFMENYEAIMTGEFEESELLKCEETLTEELKKMVSKNCYSCHEVLSLELVGDKVISTLLDIFVTVLTENTGKDLCNTKTYAGKIFHLISPNFVYVALNEHNEIGELKEDYDKLDRLSVYDKLHLAVDFISGMTDSFAVNLYKELVGIKLPL